MVRLTPTGVRRRHRRERRDEPAEPPRRIALKKAVSIDRGTRRIGSRSYRERTPAREVVDKIGRNDASRPDVQWGDPDRTRLTWRLQAIGPAGISRPNNTRGLRRR